VRQLPYLRGVKLPCLMYGKSRRRGCRVLGCRGEMAEGAQLAVGVVDSSAAARPSCFRLLAMRGRGCLAGPWTAGSSKR